MKDGTTITIGFVLLIVGYAFWYLSAWLYVNKSSDNKTGLTTGVGLLLSGLGFYFVVDCSVLNQYQQILAVFMLFAYMIICLFASIYFITGK